MVAAIIIVTRVVVSGQSKVEYRGTAFPYLLFSVHVVPPPVVSQATLRKKIVKLMLPDIGFQGQRAPSLISAGALPIAHSALPGPLAV